MNRQRRGNKMQITSQIRRDVNTNEQMKQKGNKMQINSQIRRDANTNRQMKEKGIEGQRTFE